jgi:ComF family protein
MRRSLPQTCSLCAASSGDALICAVCTAALPRLPAVCTVCALPVTAADICGACLKRPPPFAATLAAFVYGFPIDRLVQQMKYRGRLAIAEWAAAELAAAVAPTLRAREPAQRPERVVALPLAGARQRERGFNQAHEIAARAAIRLGLPIAPSLARIVAGPPQAALRWSERAKNMRGAFACCEDVRGLRIAVVDDVMTTGATLTEAAKTLRRAGATRVECWVVARTFA